jgi:Fe-S cluster assembly protein SufD
VKCAHGATISQLSDDELFYLQSRGLDPATSRTLLINAFAIEVLDAIPVNSVRNRLRTTFFTRCFQTKTYKDLL